MATISGTAGDIREHNSGNSIAEIREWSLDFSHSIIDVSSFSDIWNENIAGIRSVTGSFSGILSDDSDYTTIENALLNGSTYVIRCLLYFGVHFSGTVLITGNNPSVSYDGVTQTTFNFTGNGQIIDNW